MLQLNTESNVAMMTIIQLLGATLLGTAFIVIKKRFNYTLYCS